MVVGKFLIVSWYFLRLYVNAKVKVLTTSTFHQYVKDNELVLVDLYAPWCGHCMKLEPEYEEASNVLEEEGSKWKLAKVDATEEEDLGKEFDVQGYPTLKMFVKGKPVDYNGPRDGTGIVKFLRKKENPEDESEDADSDSQVTPLTSTTFKRFIEDNERVVVEFYAPWCGHCKKLEPEYKMAAEMLEQEGSTWKLAKVDAQEETDLGTKYGVKGYPTIKMFVGGKAVDYSGPRDAKGIVEYLLKKEQPAVRKFESTDDMTGFVKKALEGKKGAGVVYLISRNRAESSKTGFLEKFGEIMAEKIPWVKLGIVLTEKDEGMSLFRQSTADTLEEVPYKGVWNSGEVKQFAELERLPLVSPFFVRDAMSGKYDVLLINTRTPKETADVFRPFAKDLRATTRVTLVDKANLGYTAKEYGLNSTSDDVLLLDCRSSTKKPQTPGIQMDMPKTEFPGEYVKFRLEGPPTEKSLKQFLSDYKNKNLTPFVKSAPKPIVSGPVKVLTAETFESVVFDPSKIVVVKYFDPDCYACKQLEPVWVKLAKAVQDEYKHKVVVAEFDTTKNDVPFDIFYAMPTVCFYPSGAGKMDRREFFSANPSFEGYFAKVEQMLESDEEGRDEL